MYWIGVIFAFIGAGLILFALTFISLVLGGLTNSIIDGVLNRWERRRLARGG
jgi:hypothetical protein